MAAFDVDSLTPVLLFSVTDASIPSPIVVTPSNKLNSEAFAVTPSKMLSSAVVAVTPSKILSSAEVEVIALPPRYNEPERKCLH